MSKNHVDAASGFEDDGMLLALDKLLVFKTYVVLAIKFTLFLE